MERWFWQDAIFSREPGCSNLVHVLRNKVELGGQVWAVRVESYRVVVTLRAGQGKIERSYYPTDSAELTAQKLIAWRGDLFMDPGVPAIVSWYRDCMTELAAPRHGCQGLKLQVSSDGFFVRWSLDELSGAVEVYGSDGATIASFVATEVIHARHMAVRRARA
jgi:hypothetical protein